MITCKEDLINTYVKNTPELRREFLSLAVKFGLIDGESNIGKSSEDAVVAYWHDATGDNLGVGCWFAYADRIKEECRELTISDLKSTPTKFVKVEESIFDLKDELERGELYYYQGGEYFKITDTRQLAVHAHYKSAYRKVEIDWRDEVVRSLPAGYGVEAFGSKDIIVQGAFNKKQALILANAIIASLTEKPEGV